ncbi:hypothetical protein GUITHDRAFT_68995 [Guillardia theta CCMP2712]|uniref:Protein kinase domain-containing protein n=1 Tax=Guillardia theta (strain CCMP2712) TaxID=905079 RepID=L1JI20_GUITC|nr:hypothetical protein GUITHDRAFT_68995 [Guillardia theta CCMP2712]EKX47962.1 hypothetical protein GUITHDRAFT_68995 [Guillardia theta CCMP2712]|eukprot:XP_005834942.1 hypothetical protein GUITHDRAFT_68995 [Guillardia theta CCMP2712]
MKEAAEQLAAEADIFSSSEAEESDGTRHPWCLNPLELQVERNSRGKPKHVLGSGGFAVVYRASYQGTEVAVKEPHNPRDLEGSKLMRKAFFREANNLFRIHHRNVIELVGAMVVDEEGNPCFLLVTELLRRPLTEYIEETMKPASESERRARGHVVMLGLAEGLAYLHSMRIIHRDIKPQNIMLDDKDIPKLIDFGLSKEKEEIAHSKGSTRLAGTMSWMSPEKRRSKPTSTASDVYALGLVMMNVMTLETPPESQEEREKLLKETSDKGVSGQVSLWCIHEDPSRRPTAATVAMSLTMDRDLCGGGEVLTGESKV